MRWGLIARGDTSKAVDFHGVPLTKKTFFCRLKFDISPKK